MQLIIKYIRNYEFVSVEHFDGELEAAQATAQASLSMHNADSAAILNQVDPDGAALALVFEKSAH